TVTLPPDAVIVEGRVVVLPTSTLPNPRVEGETVSCPDVAVAPEPVKGTGGPGPETWTLPLLTPEAVGGKFTFNVVLWPPARFTGRDAPLTENPCPVISNAVRVAVVFPVFVSTTGKVELEPIVTCPKERLEGAAASGFWVIALA